MNRLHDSRGSYWGVEGPSPKFYFQSQLLVSQIFMEGGKERAMDRLTEGDMGRRAFHNYHSLIAEGVTFFHFFKMLCVGRAHCRPSTITGLNPQTNLSPEDGKNSY